MKKRLTKIVATIGPSSETPDLIKDLIHRGVNIFRFNLKHNSLDWHSDKIKTVNKIAKEMGANVGTLIDLQGPEIRVNLKEVLEIHIAEGEMIPMTGGSFSVSHPQIVPHLKDNQKVLIEDGSLSFVVERKDGQTYLKSMQKGIIKNRKNFNVPGGEFPVPSLVERDIEALKMAAGTGIDFVALSFVRRADDVISLKREMDKVKLSAKIIAKIETEKSLENLADIIDVVDGIMVARGDLGVEISLEKVPYFQKKMIKMAFQKGIPVITATQMLQSMVDSPNPTRAEVSDVANAFYDLTDAVMLSAESASGAYPKEAVSMLDKILVFNESKNYIDERKSSEFEIENKADLICQSAYELYQSCLCAKLNLAGFLVFTQSGKTASLISRHRPLLPIFTFVPDRQIATGLSIGFGLETFIHDVIKKNEVVKEDIIKAVNTLKEKKMVSTGQTLIVLHGDHWAQVGGTSTLKLIEV